MLIEIPPSENEYTSVWDKPVPIIEVTSKLYRVYILDKIGAPVEYGELVELLLDLDESTVVEFYINTPGGVLDSAKMLLNAVRTTKARTIGKLSGGVASAGTMIALAMDDIEVAPFTDFMIHSWSVQGQSGKANEIEAQNNHMKKETRVLFDAVYKGFLTSREIKKVIDGTDMWMSSEEIMKRLGKRATTLKNS